MVSRTMKRFDLHSKYPTACLHAVGPDASSTGALLLSLSTIAGTKISNPPWVNFQSAGWVSFQSAPTVVGEGNTQRCSDPITTREAAFAILDNGQSVNQSRD